MSTSFKIISGLLIIADLVFCLVVGFKKRTAITDKEAYFIGGKKTGQLLLFLTVWASMSGAGNFIGQAGRGSLEGISAYWMWLGDGVLGGMFFALLIAPHLARFNYLSMPHYISGYLCGGDTTVRRIAGVAALLPNVCWAGAQIMGLSYVLSGIFGIDYRIAVIVTGAVFITYTVLGGVGAVIVTDALHGLIQMFFASSVIIFGLKTFNFDFGLLKESVIQVDPSHWDINSMTTVSKLTALLTGFVGVMSNPIVWNRAFCSKDVKSARKAFGWHGIFYMGLIFIMIAIGISAFRLNPEAGDQALVWLILNKMPSWVSIFLGVGVYAACISGADTHLNAAAANVVCDIMDPKDTYATDKAVKYSRIATLLAGIISISAGLYADFIYGLATLGYAVCGGVLIPIFAIGLFYRDRKSEEFKSDLNIHAAKFAMVVGIVVSLTAEFVPAWKAYLGGGVIPAIVGTVVTYFVTAQFVGKEEIQKSA